MHHLLRAPGASEYLYQQNHFGVYRSADGGRNWEEITGDLPSDFGFPMVVHPREPGTIWVLPLQGEGRFPPGGSAAVWRSRDRGDSWSRRGEGLPQQHAYFGVLRQAMAADTLDGLGLYAGTTTGNVYASTDEGESWRQVVGLLPRILSVNAVVLDG